MHISKIIVTTDAETIEAKISDLKVNLGIEENNKVDYLEIKPTKTVSIGIKEAAKIKAWATLKPYQSIGKLIAILKADKLTPQAQNSLLKLLEEPEGETQIVLFTPNKKTLLPTIVSRCQVIEIEDKSQDFNDDLQFNTAKIVEKFKIVDKILSTKDKQEQSQMIQNILVSQLEINRQQLLHGDNTVKYSKNIMLIHETNNRIKKNVTKRLALENLIININA